MILEKLIFLAAELYSTDEDELTTETDIYDDLFSDSLDLLELSMILEEEFDLSPKDIAKMESFCTLGEIADYIDSKQKDK